METRKFITLIKPNKLWDTPYVYGKINAVFRLTCHIEDGIHQGKVAGCYEEVGRQFFQFYTTEDDYEKATQIIERWYPGLCEFDCQLTMKSTNAPVAKTKRIRRDIRRIWTKDVETARKISDQCKYEFLTYDLSSCHAFSDLGISEVVLHCTADEWNAIKTHFNLKVLDGVNDKYGKTISLKYWGVKE